MAEKEKEETVNTHLKIPKRVHRGLKMLAAKEETTLKKVILNALEEKVKDVEYQQDEWPEEEERREEE